MPAGTYYFLMTADRTPILDSYNHSSVVYLNKFAASQTPPASWLHFRVSATTSPARTGAKVYYQSGSGLVPVRAHGRHAGRRIHWQPFGGQRPCLPLKMKLALTRTTEPWVGSISVHDTFGTKGGPFQYMSISVHSRYSKSTIWYTVGTASVRFGTRLRNKDADWHSGCCRLLASAG